MNKPKKQTEATGKSTRQSTRQEVHDPGDPSKLERDARFQGNHRWGDSTRRNQGQPGNRFTPEDVSRPSHAPKTMIGSPNRSTDEKKGSRPSKDAPE